MIKKAQMLIKACGSVLNGLKLFGRKQILIRNAEVTALSGIYAKALL